MIVLLRYHLWRRKKEAFRWPTLECSLTHHSHVHRIGEDTRHIERKHMVEKKKHTLSRDKCSPNKLETKREEQNFLLVDRLSRQGELSTTLWTCPEHGQVNRNNYSLSFLFSLCLEKWRKRANSNKLTLKKRIN
jgi:hypothetical protein